MKKILSVIADILAGELDAIREAVHSAVKTPFSVTESVFFPLTNVIQIASNSPYFTVSRLDVSMGEA